jgi:hypothetical protein
VLAVVDGRSVCRRTGYGSWSTIATTDVDLACLIAVGDAIYLGTDDARLLRLEPDGRVDALSGFDAVPGRATWYAGTAMVNGQLVGPPLGVRSLSATADGVLFANVHVGGIPRSADDGRTWEPTIDIASDVHEVRTHPTSSNIVAAASALGLCISYNGGISWSIERQGLHAAYCSAVALTETDIFVAASTDHFAPRGAVYRRPIHGAHSLQPLAALPAWLDGIVDTGCIAARGHALAIADKGGNLYASDDGGTSWQRRAGGLPGPSNILVW